MSITYIINQEFNGIEIKFSEKPSRAIIDKMKGMGFRWHNVKGVWFAKNTEERLAFAKAIADKNDYTQISLFPTEQKKAESVEVSEKPKKEKAETRKKTEKASEKKAEKKADVIQMPSGFHFEFPTVKKVTINECVERVTEYKKNYEGQNDHLFVLDSLLKMCEADEVFRSRFIDKSYEDAFNCVFKKAEEMARKQKSNGVCIDSNKALEIILDYYNDVDSVKVKEC